MKNFIFGILKNDLLIKIINISLLFHQVFENYKKFPMSNEKYFFFIINFIYLILNFLYIFTCHCLLFSFIEKNMDNRKLSLLL